MYCWNTYFFHTPSPEKVTKHSSAYTSLGSLLISCNRATTKKTVTRIVWKFQNKSQRREEVKRKMTTTSDEISYANISNESSHISFALWKSAQKFLFSQELDIFACYFYSIAIPFLLLLSTTLFFRLRRFFSCVCFEKFSCVRFVRLNATHKLNRNVSFES